jgi:hypothetical protein
MYTSSEHIIIHKQIIDDKHFIRIIATDNTDKYHNEIKKTYNCEIDYIYKLYNCADLYERLVNDLNYKKFKGIKITDISSGLWQIDQYYNNDSYLVYDKTSKLGLDIKYPEQNIVDINNWYNDTYIIYIKSKLQSYITDLDEEDYFDIYPENIDWGKINIKAECVFEEGVMYKLKDVELCNEKYILTRDHILSLTFLYVNNNYGSILEKEDPPVIDLKYEKCDNIRGCSIGNCNLLTEDVETLLKLLNINDNTLKRITTCSHYVKNLESNALVKHITCETSTFGSWYGYLADFQPTDKNDNDIESCFISKMPNYIAPHKLTSKPVTETNTVNPIKNKVLYKHLINKTINIFDIELVYLKEFERLSNINYESEITDNILNILDKKKISKNIILDIEQILDVLKEGALEEHECIDKTQWNHQKSITKLYVDLHKNDNAETIASTVIENVYDFLKPTINENINKNQIGKDLVELGVKKTRKTKGYVYGIEETNFKLNTNTNFKIDKDKVEKENHQLRKQIPIPAKFLTSYDYASSTIDSAMLGARHAIGASTSGFDKTFRSFYTS